MILKPSAKPPHEPPGPNDHLSPAERYARAIERRDALIRDRRNAERQHLEVENERRNLAQPGRRNTDTADRTTTANT